MAKKMFVKKDDEVIVISGNDKGKRGKVIAVSPDEDKVIVEKAHVKTKHVRPKKQGDPGGIMKAEGAVYACKVQLFCSKCGKGVRARIETVEGKDGKKEKIRVCSKCGQKL